MKDSSMQNHDKKLLRISLILAGLVLIGIVIGGIVNYTDVPSLLTYIGIGLVAFYLVLADIFTAFSDVMPFASDVFEASIKGFTMPGLIFELSLDGIVWFICVKLLLSLLSIVLSVGWFLLVIAFGTLVAAITFPFVLYRSIKKEM